MKQSRREVLDQKKLDFDYLRKTMRSLFPKKNDCACKEDLEEVLEELIQFNIDTRKELRLLMKKYRSWLLDIEKEPMDAVHQRLYREDLGDEEFLDAMRRQYWFCYPALIRNAMEAEFGDKYESFASERDVI